MVNQKSSQRSPESQKVDKKHVKTECCREGRAERKVSQKNFQRSPEIQNVVNNYVKYNVVVKVGAVKPKLPEESRELASSQHAYKTQCVREGRAGREPPRGLDQVREKCY